MLTVNPPEKKLSYWAAIITPLNTMQ